MKSLKISTVLLLLMMCLMSMGFPHQATDKDKSSSSRSWGCTARHD